MYLLRLLSIIILLAASCKPYEVVSTNRTIKDSVIVREVEKEVLVPGYEVQSNSINIDSLQKLLKTGVSRETIQKTLIREDPETKARVGILIDELGNLTALCEKQDQMIKVLTEEREYYRETVEQIILKEKQNLFEKIGTYLKYTAYIITFSIAAYLAYRIIRN